MTTAEARRTIVSETGFVICPRCQLNWLKRGWDITGCPRCEAEQLRTRLATAEALALTNGARMTRAEALLETASDALRWIRRQAAKPMRSWETGDVIDAVRADEVAEEALDAIAAALAPTEPDGASAAIPEGTPTAETKAGDE